MLTKRTNILFDPDMWSLLTRLSRQKKATVGELVRRAVRKSYALPKSPPQTQLHPLIELRNLAKTIDWKGTTLKEFLSWRHEGHRL